MLNRAVEVFIISHAHLYYVYKKLMLYVTCGKLGETDMHASEKC